MMNCVRPVIYTLNVAVANGVYFALYLAALALGAPYAAALTLAYPLSWIGSFMVRRYVVFRAQKGVLKSQLPRALALTACVYTLQLVVTSAGVELVGLDERIAFVVAMALSIPISYAVDRRWVFRSRV